MVDKNYSCTPVPSWYAGAMFRLRGINNGGINLDMVDQNGKQIPSTNILSITAEGFLQLHSGVNTICQEHLKLHPQTKTIMTFQQFRDLPEDQQIANPRPEQAVEDRIQLPDWWDAIRLEHNEDEDDGPDEDDFFDEEED